jgi:hypothetical protein
MAPRVDLSVILPAHRGGRNLLVLLPELRQVLASVRAAVEILVVVRDPDPDTGPGGEGERSPTHRATRAWIRWGAARRL